MHNKMSTVYVLLCEGNRFYVGKTERPLQSRIEEHFNQNGSEWTRKYKPIKVVEQVANADEFDEDKYTKKYMKQYGINKVRGGTYTQIHLPDLSVMALEKEICNASNLCFRCSRPGHFANQCFASTKANVSHIDDSSCDEEYWCCEYCDQEFDSESEAYRHEQICKMKDIQKFAKMRVSDRHTCFRCGRVGHYANECYASFHYNGKRLY